MRQGIGRGCGDGAAAAVQVVNPDPSWPVQARRLVARLRESVGDQVEATLTKSRASLEDLVRTVEGLITRSRTATP